MNNPFKKFTVYDKDYSNDNRVAWTTEIYYRTEEERKQKREATIELFKKVLEALYGSYDEIEIYESSTITFTARIKRQTVEQ